MLTLAAVNTVQGVAGTATAVTYTIFGMQLASGVETYQVLAQGQLATSTGVLYTVPASTTAFVKKIVLANVTGSLVSGVALYVNGSAVGNAIILGLNIPANGQANIDDFGLSVYDTNGNCYTTAAVVFDAVAPTVTTPLATSAVGSAVTPAHRDHAHQSPGGVVSIVAASASLNTTETQVVAATIPANFCQAATTFLISLFGICTSSAANLSTFTVRMGTGNSNSDAALTVVTCTAATSGTAVGFFAEFLVTIRAAGSNITAAAGGMVVNSGTTGISSNGVGGVAASGTISGTVNTTVLNYLQVTYKSAASTTTATFQNAVIEVVKM